MLARIMAGAASPGPAAGTADDATGRVFALPLAGGLPAGRPGGGVQDPGGAGRRGRGRLAGLRPAADRRARPAAGPAAAAGGAAAVLPGRTEGDRAVQARHLEGPRQGAARRRPHRRVGFLLARGALPRPAAPGHRLGRRPGDGQPRPQPGLRRPRRRGPPDHPAARHADQPPRPGRGVLLPHRRVPEPGQPRVLHGHPARVGDGDGRRGRVRRDGEQPRRRWPGPTRCGP